MSQGSEFIYIIAGIFNELRSIPVRLDNFLVLWSPEYCITERRFRMKFLGMPGYSLPVPAVLP